MSKDSNESAWLDSASRLTRRVNLGWWVERGLPFILGIALVGAVLLLLFRGLGWEELRVVWLVIAGSFVATALLCAWGVRKRMESRASALVRLETALGLHAQLSSAAAGAGAWPAYPASGVALPLTWQWQRAGQVLVASASLLALAAWVPLPSAAATKPRVIEKPLAVKEVETWMEQLRQDDAVSEPELKEVEQRVEELLRRPSEQWYEHSSLEAAEHLRDETGQDLQELGTALEQMRGSLLTLDQLGDQASEAAQKGLAKQFQDNLQGLRSGGIVANEDLLDQLKGIDPTSFSKLSQQQKDALKNKLKDNADALREALKNSPSFDFKECPCAGNNPSPRGGQGDPKRGRDDAELTLKNQGTDLGTKRTETISQPLDLDRLAPGDMVGLADGKHAVQQDARMGSAGGGIQSAGSGGSAVDRENLLPAEREVLRSYFK